MRITLIIMSLLLSFNLSAVTEIGRIEAIDYPERITEDVLIFLSSGKVVKVDQSSIEILGHLQKSRELKDWLSLEVDESRYVRKIEVNDGYEEIQLTESNKSVQNEDFLPSVLKSNDWAKNYFSEARKKDKESQCFNRAHIWSYEWHKKHKFNSSKIFLFFTRKYIREHNFPWWFHIAPYVHVTIDRQLRERVMDMKYTSGPTMIKDWIKRFIKIENPGCLAVKTYSDYANFPENGNCYIMKTSMYYYWPLDLEIEELHGISKTTWVSEEVKTAYLEAFDVAK